MLSDDIYGTIDNGIRGVGAVTRGAAKGALLGLVIAFAVGTLIAGAPLLAAGATALFSGAIGAGLTAIGTGLLGGMGSMVGLVCGASVGPSLLLAGAGIGAAVMGISSVIPGVSDMHERALRKHRATHHAVVHRTVVLDRSPVVVSPAIERESALGHEYENPYFIEGKGAQLASRGSGTVRVQEGRNIHGDTGGHDDVVVLHHDYHPSRS